MTAIARYRLDHRSYDDVFTALILVAVALVVRAPWFGNPLPHVDDEFYLLVGDRMWSGLVPYVDIWDRKPIGLFLIYAALRPLSSDGLLAYQIGASVFATATAFLIVRLGLRLGKRGPAIVAGVLYLVYLPIIGGNSGQSPVFYNLFIASAALLIVRAEGKGPETSLTRPALAAMALIGIAIQVKYTAFVEGVAFGLYILLLEWSRSRRPCDILKLGIGMIAVALLPTILVMAAYFAFGQGAAFLQANVLSIFQAKTPAGVSNLGNLALTAARIAVVVSIAAVSVLLLLRRPSRATSVGFFVLWSIFGLLDIVIIGRFYGHYALPALVPLCILAIPVFESPLAAAFIVSCTAGFVLLASTMQAASTKALNETYVTKMVRALEPHRKDGCPYLHDGPSIVYLRAQACLPSRFVFPEHLSTALEAGATDATASMAALLARRPPVIAISDRLPHRLPNAATKKMLEAKIARDYHVAEVIPEPNGTDHQTIYVRNDLP